MSADRPSPDPIEPKLFGEAAGTVTRSNPPFPLFIDDGQAPPEAYGRTSYTSRPPWMTEQGAVRDVSGVSLSYVVDATSLPPFAGCSREKDAPTADPGNIPAGPLPLAAAPAPGFPDRSTRRSEWRRKGRWVSSGLKWAALALILVGGYLVHGRYFDPESRAPGGGATATGSAGANARNGGISGANAGSHRPVDPVVGGTGTELRSDPSRPVGPRLIAGDAREPAGAQPGMATDGSRRTEQITGVSRDVTIAIVNQSAVPLPGRSHPSAAFLNWVRGIEVAGVRGGDSTRVLIDGVAYELGQMVDHRLRITFEGMAPEETMLLFRDASGAMVGKRY